MTIVGDEVEDWGLSCAAEAYGSAVSEWGLSTPQQSLTRFKGRRAEIARQQIQDSYDAIEDVLPLEPQPYAESYPSSQYILRPWTDQTGRSRVGPRQRAASARGKEVQKETPEEGWRQPHGNSTKTPRRR